jgi:anti-anti-sigma factor
MQSEQLTVNVTPGAHKGERVIKVNGPLTMTSLLGFQNVVRAEKAPTVILDLSQVPYIDSTGLGSVVNAHISCINSGRHLAIIGVSERVRTLFRLARLERVLAIFPTLEEAEKGLTRLPVS